jgi:hypothetical protein
MTHQAVVTSEVEVAVDPAAAFKAFTEEMDCWWVRGPINFYDAGRVVEVRCESGVGGRIGEVLDDRASGPMREKARITVWEPGVRLCWMSSVDDVATEVRFEPAGAGTRVVVEHRIPAGGRDDGGTAWSRVVPLWFGRWCARRDWAPGEQADIARLALGLYYARPAAAAHWLADTFGLEPVSELPSQPDPLPSGPHGGPWIELRAGNASLMIFQLEAGSRAGADRAAGAAHVPWIYVDDLDAHLAHAEQAGATILSRKDWPWLPTYVTADLEGNRWTFAQARPTQRG